MGVKAGGRAVLKRTLEAFRTNLSLKLIAFFVAGGVFLACLIGALTEFGFERNFASQVQPHLRHYMHQISQQIGAPPDIEKAKALAQSRPIVIRIFADELLWASDGSAHRPKRIRRHDRPHRGEGRRRDNQLQSAPPRLFYSKGTMFILKPQPGYEVYIGFKLRQGHIAWLPIIAGVLVLIGLYGFYLLTRWLFKPVRDIQEGVRLIGEGQVGHQIKVNRRDELGQLAQRVNKMSTDLAQMLKAKRDLLLALSHELKSPLARSRVSLALLEPSDLQANLLRDQLQIERLIDEVLESERAHQDHALLHRKPTDINQLVASVLTDDLLGLEVDLQIPADLPEVEVDAGQLRRLLRNLLENAQRYHQTEQGMIKLIVSADNDLLEIEVSDRGAGIAPEHLGRLTEAFYRVDASRTPDSGGLGLGLYLCQNIVEAHHGTMQISSQVGHGTQVKVMIPV